MTDLIKAKQVETSTLAASPAVVEEKPSADRKKNASGWFLRLMLKYYIVASVASYLFVALMSGEWSIQPEFLYAQSIAVPILGLLIGCVETVMADREHSSRFLLLTAVFEFAIGGAAGVLQLVVRGVPDLWIGTQIGLMFGTLMGGWWLIKKVFW